MLLIASDALRLTRRDALMISSPFSFPARRVRRRVLRVRGEYSLVERSPKRSLVGSLSLFLESHYRIGQKRRVTRVRCVNVRPEVYKAG